MWVTLHLRISKSSVCKNPRRGLPWRLSCEGSAHQCGRHRSSSEPERSRSLGVSKLARRSYRACALDSLRAATAELASARPLLRSERLRTEKPEQEKWRVSPLATQQRRAHSDGDPTQQKQLREVIYICKESPEKAMWVLEPY